MFNIFILVLAVVTLVLMTADPSASAQQAQPSAWQKAKLDIQEAEIQETNT